MRDQQSGSAALLQRLIEDDESLLESNDPKIAAVLVERLYANSWATRYVPVPMLFGAFIIYRDYLLWWHILGLTALYTAGTLFLDMQRAAFERNGGMQDRSIDWARRFTFGSTLTGATWGLLGWFAYPPGDFALQAVLSVAWAGLALSSLNTRAVHLPAFYAFLVAMSVPFFGRGFLFGETSTMAMAFFGTFLFASLCFSAQVYNRRERIDIALRLRLATLIAELDQARSVAEAGRRERDQCLADLTADFTSLQRLGGIGFWTWEAATGEASWSKQTARLLGLPPPPGNALLSGWLDGVHPDDRDRLRRFFNALPEVTRTAEVTFQLADGRTQLRATAEPSFAESGELQCIRGVLRGNSQA